MSTAARIKARPAETTAGTGGIVTVIAAILGADATTVALLGALSSFAPAGVSWLADHQGVRGVYRRIAFGDRGAVAPVVHPPLVDEVKAKQTTARKTRPKVQTNVDGQVVAELEAHSAQRVPSPRAVRHGSGGRTITDPDPAIPRESRTR